MQHPQLVQREFGGSRVLYDQVKYDTNLKLRRFVGSGGARRLAESVGRACLVVLGGDGTMLRAIRDHYREKLPFLGVNFGTKGFLLNEHPWVAGNPGAFAQRPYPLLHAAISHGGKVSHAVAFNEITVRAHGASMVTLDLSVGGHSVSRLRGDGLIISTPAGSTGYSRSARGPVLPHATPSLIATPVNAFEPLHAPAVVFNDQDEAVVGNASQRGQTLSVYADSHVALCDHAGPVEVAVRARRGEVILLVPESRLVDWDRKTYAEQGFSPATKKPARRAK